MTTRTRVLKYDIYRAGDDRVCVTKYCRRTENNKIYNILCTYNIRIRLPTLVSNARMYLYVIIIIIIAIMIIVNIRSYLYFIFPPPAAVKNEFAFRRKMRIHIIYLYDIVLL